MIEIHLNNVWSRIRNLKDVETIDAIDKETSFYVEGYQFMKAFKNGYMQNGEWRHWDGKKHLLNGSLVFPTGLLNLIENKLKSLEKKYKIIDDRPKIKYGPGKDLHFTPRYYQDDAADIAYSKGGGLIRIGTGGGKTKLIAQIAAKFDVPTMIYVVGKDLLYQTHEEVSEALNEEIGIIGDGQCTIKKINIYSVWTAITSFNLKKKIQISLDDEDWSPEVKPVGIEKERIRKAIQNCQLAMFDEAHYLACDTIQQIYKASKKCQHIFGLSGTDWRDDGADLLLESVCGPRIYSMTSSELIDGEFLVQPKITMVNMPKMGGLPAKWPSVYSKYITNNDIRNAAIINASTKLHDMGRRILVLVRYLKHGNLLNDELSKHFKTHFVNGKVDGQTRKRVKADFEDGRLDCLIASSVFDIGIDIPCLDGLILAGGGKSTVRCLQRAGRVIRNFPGKKDAYIYDPIDNARYVNEHSLIRANMYLSEPNFLVKLPKNFNKNSKEMKKIQAKLKKTGKIAE